MIENIEQDVQKKKKQWDKIICAEETNTYSFAEWLWIAVLGYYYYYYILLLICFSQVFSQFLNK